ncbi:MAG: hypothetical protein CVU64_15095 [Deltaproteobacteria bacterium HGW-Deltaproteobacteria-21]|nr:MAG: hypothetical protein CVU64_15095 [Deltaproteobacteria bacterium HGW-Deltaproteobacteria-21]
MAEVNYCSWTKNGLLRHTSFKELREDKRVGDPDVPEDRFVPFLSPIFSLKTLTPENPGVYVSLLFQCGGRYRI